MRQKRRQNRKYLEREKQGLFCLLVMKEGPSGILYWSVCVCVCGFCRSRAMVEAVSRVGGEGGGEEGRERGEEEDAEYKVGSEPDEDETTIGEQEMFERQAAGSVDRADELDELNRESRFLSSLLPPPSSLSPPPSLLPPSLTSSLSPFVPPFPFLSPSLPSP